MIIVKNRPMKTILFLFISTVLLGLTINSNPNSTFTSLEKAFREGDSKKIASYVDEKILMDINKQESVYSKTQSELILKDFFDKNKPKTFVVKSKSTTQGNFALLGTYTSESDKNFRVSIKLRESGSSFVLDKISVTSL